MIFFRIDTNHNIIFKLHSYKFFTKIILKTESLTFDNMEYNALHIIHK